MVNQWFKFYGSEYLNDLKMQQLNGYERSCWLTILCLASQTKDGVIKYLSESHLLLLSGVPEKLDIFQKFIELDMIEVSNGNVTVKNWVKRQYSESINRVREFRKKQKSNGDGNGNVTTEENRIEENRIDNLATDVAEIIKAFEVIDSKNKTYYGNRTQRLACEFLLKEYGMEKVLARIAVLPKTNKVPFFPRINSPNDLKEKWVKLEDAVATKRSEINSNKNYVL